MSFEKIENATKNQKEFQIGDFVEFAYDEIDFKKNKTFVTNAFGVVMYNSKYSGFQIAHFLDGECNYETRDPDGYFRKAAKEEGMGYLKQLSRQFEKMYKKGGLEGALAARKKFFVDAVTNFVNKGPQKKDIYGFGWNINVKDPLTGYYVVRGVYSGNGPGTDLEAVMVSPRKSEYDIAQLLYILQPERIGNVPSEVNNTPATSHGDLVCYQAFEIPEFALHLALEKNPKRIRIELPV